MVAFRHFVVAVSALAIVAMNAGISTMLDPVRSIEAFAVESNADLLVITRRVVTAAAAATVDVPVATNTNPVASTISLEDLFASSLWKDGPFAVTHEEQVSNSTNMFASSLLQTASASRRLRDVMDDIKPLTQDSVDNVLAWFANTLQASRVAFRFAVNAVIPKASFPHGFLSPEILNILSKQCPLIVTTCEEDAKPLTVLQALRIASRYAITTLTIGSIAFFCMMFGSWQILLGCVGDDPLKLLILVVGTMVVALVVEYVTEAIWYYYWLVFIHVDAEANADADDDVLEDADDALEDVDDGVASQDDVPEEAPVVTVTIAAPLRRSKRVAAQLCRALCSEVAPDPNATSGPRRSARLAAKPRVNCKPYPACH